MLAGHRGPGKRFEAILYIYIQKRIGIRHKHTPGLIVKEQNGKIASMPTISMFYGILIRMYLGKKEHNPPHFHAFYQSSRGVFEIGSGEMVEGDLPARQVRLVSAWIELHREELLADWELAQSGEKPYSIEPLR